MRQILLGEPGGEFADLGGFAGAVEALKRQEKAWVGDEKSAFGCPGHGVSLAVSAELALYALYKTGDRLYRLGDPLHCAADCVYLVSVSLQ